MLRAIQGPVTVMADARSCSGLWKPPLGFKAGGWTQWWSYDSLREKTVVGGEKSYLPSLRLAQKWVSHRELELEVSAGLPGTDPGKPAQSLPHQSPASRRELGENL